MGTRAIRVMLVDDHALVRVGLRDLFEGEADVEVVGEAGSVLEAVAEADRCEPDIVVMDVQLPDGNGIEATREIRNRRPDTRVVMLTAFRDEEAAVAAVLAGAAAHVMKNVRGNDLVRTVRAVAAGETLIEADLSSLSTKLPGTEKDETGLATLSAKERKILELLPSGSTNKEIAAALDLSEKTVKNYVSTILMKLRVTRRSEAAAYFIKKGGRERGAS